MGHIYGATSPSGERYIGQTIRAHKKRKGEHKYHAGRYARKHEIENYKNSCERFYEAIQKYGFDAFTWEILVECIDTELDMYERKFIAEYDCIYPKGYNMTPGGRGNVIIHTDETRQKMRTSRKAYIAKAGDKLKRTTHGKGLPMHMAYYMQDNVVGYKVYQHPLCTTKKFSVSKYGSLETAKAECLAYLTRLNNGEIAQDDTEKLPRGVSKRKQGYRIRFKHLGVVYDETFMTRNPADNLQDALIRYHSIKSSSGAPLKVPPNIYIQSNGTFLAKINIEGEKYTGRFDNVDDAQEYIVNTKDNFETWKMFRAQMPVGLVD